MRKILKKETKITKSMTFGEIIKKYPKAVSFLFEKGMHCVGCHAAHTETIEQGALAHGINSDKLIKELNSLVSKEKKKK